MATRSFKDRHGDVVTFEDDEDFRDKLVSTLVKWYSIYGTEGDYLQQSDALWVEGPQVLTSIADDIFKFEHDYDKE